jgi:glycosyltransferase involved in cell wall biosynthesis
MKLSIILPSLRLENARKCVNSIFTNSITEFELIVVGNKNVIGHVFEADKLILDDKCIGTTYAIQKGLEQAEGEFIVTLSDDALVAPKWDIHMITYLESLPKDKVVLGNFRVYDHTGEMPRIGYYGKQFSMFPILRKSDINKLGCYYSQEFNAFYSDPDLGVRVAEANGIVANCSSAFIYHIFNPDDNWLKSKSLYWEHDEEVFKKKWKHLGEFRGCEVIK